MWEERELQKLPRDRKQVPVLPTEISSEKSVKSINKYNAIVSEAFTNNVMVRCPNCFRTFLEDRIEIHLRSCTSENPHKIAPSIAKIEESKLSEDPIKTYSQKSEPKTPNSTSKTKTAAPSAYEKSFSRPRALLCHIW